jgi:hypothetical protein
MAGMQSPADLVLPPPTPAPKTELFMVMPTLNAANVIYVEDPATPRQVFEVREAPGVLELNPRGMTALIVILAERLHRQPADVLTEVLEEYVLLKRAAQTQ